MTVRVVHGANEACFPLEGKTIDQAVRRLRDAFNIPLDACASVNGQEVDHDYMLADGDTVEFFERNGAKGGVHEFWSESEVTDLFGGDAVEEMRGLEIEPVRVSAYTSDQIASFLSQRVGNPKPTKHGLLIDHGRFAVSYWDQGPLLLGNTISFHLFARLARRPNVYVDFRKLRDEVWKDGHTTDSTISRAISRLRLQLEEGGITGVTLETQRHAVRLKLW